MTCTDAQVRQIMKERSQGKTQQQAALKANVKSRKTVYRYERLRRLPSELKEPHTWRTRADPFAADWPQLEQMLTISPELEAKTLFDWLCEEQPGKYQAGQLRTLQRRVAHWRALHQAHVASLAQVRQPGEMLQSDGTWLTALGVTIQGTPFKHLLIHCVLPYSNWEWGCLAQSESLLALREAIQRTLHKLAYAPRYHQTDNSTAATYLLGHSQAENTSQRRTYHPLYLELLSYYGMQPHLTHLAAPDENGDVEALHGGLKRALHQYLLLRGSRDFESVERYAAFVDQVMERRNQLRQRRLAEEIAVMQRITQPPLAAYREWRLRVSPGSLIRLQTHTYSVPTSLIGQQVLVRQYEWHLEVYYQQQLIQRMPRLTGRFQHHINYRHLVDTLLRKPGGFRAYRYQQALFPQPVFRETWDRLNQWQAPHQADLTYLRILNLAAKHLECDVAAALALLLAQPERFDDRQVTHLLLAQPAGSSLDPWPATLAPLTVDLRRYDALLQGGL
jgi:hypothetical protein